MPEEQSPIPVLADFPQPEGLAGDFSAAEEEALAHVSLKIEEGKSIEEILQVLFDHVQTVIPCDRVGLAFLADDDSRVEAHVAIANYGPLRLQRGYAADLQGSSLERVLRSGRPRIIGDLDLYARAHPNSDSTHRLMREGIRSSMTCPLVAGGRPLGFFFFSSRQPNAYTEREVLLELKVAQRLGRAVEKAYRMDQVEASKRAYLELLAFVSHELKNPLASIISEGKVLEEGYLGPMNETRRKIVSKMVRKAEFLLGLVREYLDLARLEQGHLQVHPRKGADLWEDSILPALEIIQPQMDEKHMTLVRKIPEGRLEMECDPALMSIVFINLLGNAVKYGNEGGAIELSLETGTTLRASVTNEGPGFQDHQRNLLFRKFSRIPSPEFASRKGSGVGLYTTWWIVNRHGGKIWADSEPGRWARFTFEIPQPLPSFVHMDFQETQQ